MGHTRTTRESGSRDATWKRTSAAGILLVVAVAALLAGCDALRSIVQERRARDMARTMREYHFGIGRDGWELMRPQKRALLSLCRTEAGKVVTYAEVRALKKDPRAAESEEARKEELALLTTPCREHPRAAGPGTGPSSEVVEAALNDLKVYSCDWECDPQKVRRAYTCTLNVFIAPPGSSYDYVVSTSRPTEDVREGREVKRLLESFVVTR